MGTTIELTIGDVCIDWSKNSRGNDHGHLFQDVDRKKRRSEQIDYDYFEQNNLSPSNMESAFCRSLRTVLPRIELLGFHMTAVRRAYEMRLQQWREENEPFEDDVDDEKEESIEPLSFDEFVVFIKTHPIATLDATFITDSSPGGSRDV